MSITIYRHEREPLIVPADTLCSTDLHGADLRDSELRGADLCTADLRDADLRGADLRDADLRGADVRDADLCTADLRNADLRDADLRGADLRDADLRGAKLFRTGVLISHSYPYDLGVTPTHAWIGCQLHSIAEWFRLEALPDDRRVELIANWAHDAIEVWQTHWPILRAMIECSRAQTAGREWAA